MFDDIQSDASQLPLSSVWKHQALIICPIQRPRPTGVGAFTWYRSSSCHDGCRGSQHLEARVARISRLGGSPGACFFYPSHFHPTSTRNFGKRSIQPTNSTSYGSGSSALQREDTKSEFQCTARSEFDTSPQQHVEVTRSAPSTNRTLLRTIPNPQQLFRNLPICHQQTEPLPSTQPPPLSASRATIISPHASSSPP